MRSILFCVPYLLPMKNDCKVNQNSYYTFKYNNGLGRHGWLRLTPAYSVKLVEEILAGKPTDKSILDPFAGTSTTALCAAYKGFEASTVELNPFSVWLGKVKTEIYDKALLERMRAVGLEITEGLRNNKYEPTDFPNLHNIERWWGEEALVFLAKLKRGISEFCGRKKATDLLQIAFCRTLILISNASFNHQSMSFKKWPSNSLFGNHLVNYADVFNRSLSYVIETAFKNPSNKSEILQGDALELHNIFHEKKFDLVITSPPYANRISYIRELRPYMYWLDYLENGKDAGELDWKTIGGTWGSATSKLNNWENQEKKVIPSKIGVLLGDIAKGKNKNGMILSKYVEKYLMDMWNHFKSLIQVLNSGAEVHYIVGNSSFYGHLVPIEEAYQDMMQKLGFRNIEVKIIRKRNSNRNLYEFDVCATFNPR